jgi:uncharacterized membrane protein YcgQ (UPF0703/DUF1980 family)
MKSIKLILFSIVVVTILIAILIFVSDNKSTPVSTNTDENKSVDIYSENKKQESKKINVKLTDNFFNGMVNEIFVNCKNYEGKTIGYEGFAYLDEDNVFGVLRKFYCCGTDSYFVGFECELDGEKPKNDTWVRIEGIIKVRETQNGSVPYVKITNLEVTKERGQEMVYQ